MPEGYHADRECLILEHVMAAIFKEIESQALQLSPLERGELIHRLILSLEGTPDDTPEAIAQAWDEEIARRVADMDAGCTQWIPADEVMARLRAKIGAAKANAGQS
jgi:putative addiction module component (TIGR02574 family)